MLLSPRVIVASRADVAAGVVELPSQNNPFGDLLRDCVLQFTNASAAGTLAAELADIARKCFVRTGSYVLRFDEDPSFSCRAALTTVQPRHLDQFVAWSPRTGLLRTPPLDSDRLGACRFSHVPALMDPLGLTRAIATGEVRAVDTFSCLTAWIEWVHALLAAARSIDAKSRARLEAALVDLAPAMVTWLAEQEHAVHAEFLRAIGEPGAQNSAGSMLAITTALARIQRYRLQALRTYPSLFWALNTQIPITRGPEVLSGMPARMGQILAAVDAGLELVPALSRIFEVPPWAIRRLQRLTIETVQPYAAWREHLVADIARVGPDFPLARNRDVYYLAFCLRRMPEDSRVFAKAMCQPLRPVDIAALRQVHARQEQINVSDYVSAIQRRADDPASGPDETVEIHARMPFAEWVTQSRLWHAAHFAGDDPIPHYSGPATQWPPLCEPVNIDGYRLVPLRSTSDLLDEAEAMRHCVATYVPVCKAGKSFVVSVRRGERRIASIEVTRDDVDKFSIRQAVGPENAPLKPALKLLVDRFVASLNSGRIALNPAVRDASLWITTQEPADAATTVPT